MSTTKIVIIYFFNYLTNLLINFDHGIIPACTKEMKHDLNLNDLELGLLGSAVYGGLVTGSIVGSSLFAHIKTKTIVWVSVVLCLFSLTIFLTTTSIYVLFVSRFLVGFFQIFLVVFFPVWIDFYGAKNKTLWLTFMQLGVALGAVLGYLITSLFITYSGNWVHPYELQILLLIPCALFFLLFCSDDDLDTRGIIQSRSQLQILLEDQQPSKPLNALDRYKLLLQNKIFLYTMLSLSSLFFVVTGLQFWVSDYFRNVLLVPQSTVFKGYIVVSLTAPILGVTCGGILLHYTGGYDGEQALRIATMEAILASVSATPIPFMNTYNYAIALLWLVLFFGGSLVPAVTGIMICSIPPQYRSIGNSISHVFQELLGYLPSPVLYGLVISLTGGPTSRYGMGLLVAWSYTGVIFISFALRNEKKVVQEIIKNEEIELNPFENVEMPNDQKQQKGSITFPHIDYAQFRKQTSLSLANSNYVIHQRSRATSFDKSGIWNEQFVGKSLRRQSTIMATINNVANMMGRVSIDINLQQDYSPKYSHHVVSAGKPPSY